MFWNLKRLESLDLSRNNIINIHSMAFQTGVPLLTQLDLSGNLLSKIPFTVIASLESLKSLDFSNNRIETIQDTFTRKRMKLDKLLLRENNIRILPKYAFRNFNWVNLTSLQGNPLHIIENNAFLDSGMRDIQLNNCRLSLVRTAAFRGLGRSLESLDLSTNRLSVLPSAMLEEFENIKRLKLSENMLAVSPNASFSGFRHTIEELELRGEHMRYVPLREISIMRSLRKIGMSSSRDFGHLRLTQFEEFPPGLEVLELT